MSEQPLPTTQPDEQPIEAGEVGEIKDLQFHEAQHRAETARSLAKWLVVLLGAGLGVHLLAGLHSGVWRQRGSDQELEQHL